MFIKRERYQKELEQAEERLARVHNANDQLRECIKNMESNQISFADYYEEQVNYWIGEFSEKPTKHKLIVVKKVSATVAGGSRAIHFEYDDIEQAEKDFALLQEQMMERADVLSIEGKFVINANDVESIFFEKSEHPQPYTDEEIEAWAKEKVNEEMKGWKVVKPVTSHGLIKELFAKAPMVAKAREYMTATATEICDSSLYGRFLKSLRSKS
jgi:hypothetical protein